MLRAIKAMCFHLQYKNVTSSDHGFGQKSYANQNYNERKALLFS